MAKNTLTAVSFVHYTGINFIAISNEIANFSNISLKNDEILAFFGKKDFRILSPYTLLDCIDDAPLNTKKLRKLKNELKKSLFLANVDIKYIPNPGYYDILDSME